MAAFFFLFSFRGWSAEPSDYFISVFDSTSARQVSWRGQQILFCGLSDAADNADDTSVLRISRTASRSTGVGALQRRGMKVTVGSVSELAEYSGAAIHRLSSIWRESGRYSEEHLSEVLSFHKSLSQHRTKLITIESVDPMSPGFGPEGHSAAPIDGPKSNLFSAIRIYDSSPGVMKSFGRRYPLPQEDSDEMVDLVERSFPDFNLTKALYEANIPRARYTWSLGLISVTGQQEGALRTLSSQAADLLDLHYNERDYFNFGRTDIIGQDEVDIVFFGSGAIRRYYQKEFGIQPLFGLNGKPLTRKKYGKTYYIFHIKGSEFLQKFFNFRFNSPIWGNKSGLRDEEDLHRYFSGLAKKIVSQLNPKDYEVQSFDDFSMHILQLAVELGRIDFEFMSSMSEETMGLLLGKFLLLRRELPDDLFKSASDRQIHDLATALYLILGNPSQSLPKMEESISALIALDILIWDPLQAVMNRALKN